MTMLNYFIALGGVLLFAALAFAAHVGFTIFRAACRLGGGGIVSKRPSSPYRSGRSLGEGQKAESIEARPQQF